MSLTESLQTLLDSVAFSVDKELVKVVLAEYADLERRYYLGDWSPAECNAGRFCESIVPPLNMLDRGTAFGQTPNEFVKKLLNPDISHSLDGVDRKNLSRVISSVYEIRSSRNAVHLAPGYTADYVDSMLTLSSCKWLLCEFVRLSSGQANSVTADMLRGIAQLGDPVVFEIEGRPVIMRTDLSAPQEVLLLLFHRPGYRATKAELVGYSEGFHRPNSVGMAISRLEAKREIVKSSDGYYHLSHLGRTAALKLLPS